MQVAPTGAGAQHGRVWVAEPIAAGRVDEHPLLSAVSCDGVGEHPPVARVVRVGRESGLQVPGQRVRLPRPVYAVQVCNGGAGDEVAHGRPIGSPVRGGSPRRRAAAKAHAARCDDLVCVLGSGRGDEERERCAFHGGDEAVVAL